MSEWKEYKLKDAIEKFIDYRGKTPTKVSKGIPLITAKVVKDGSLLTPDEFIEESEYLSWMTRGFPKKDDVVLTTEAPLGEVAMITNENIALAQRIILLRGKPELLSNHFLFYSLRTGLMQHRLQARASCSTVQGIKSSELREIMIPLPSVPEQKQIADVLSCLDRKIENLRRQNETLEAIAKTLFKHWFIDFEFPDADGKPYKSSGGGMWRSAIGDIPEGWHVGKLEEMGKIVCGKTPSKAEKSFYGQEIPFIKIPDMHGKVFVLDTNDGLSIHGSSSQINKLIPAHSINISCIATVGLVTINVMPSHTNQQINSIVLNNINFLEFLYFQCRDLSKKLNSIGSGGTATLNVSTGIFSKLEILVPSNFLISKYHAISNSIFEKILLNTKQVQTLTKTRDALLPKLMSGQLRVKE